MMGEYLRDELEVTRALSSMTATSEESKSLRPFHADSGFDQRLIGQGLASYVSDTATLNPPNTTKGPWASYEPVDRKPDKSHG